MAGIKITDLPAVVSAQLTDVFPVDQLPGPVTYKESNSQLFSLFKTNGAALTSFDDTNVTMALAGSPSNALLNATQMVLGWTGLLSVGRGGTAKGSFTPYTVICAGPIADAAFQNVASVGTSGQVLTSNGAGLLPTWQATAAPASAALTKVDDTNVTLTLGGSPATALLQATSITAGWTGQLSETRGGTAQSTYILGDTLYSSAANTLSKLAGNTTAVKQYLSQTGTGAVSAAPAWATVAGGDITGAALTKVDDTNVTMTLGGTPSTALLRAASMTLGWTGQLGVSRGGTGLGALTAHYVLIGNGTSALTLLAPSATSGIPLISQGALADPIYGTAVVAGGGTGNTTFTAYSVICAGTTATGAFQNVSGVGTANQVLVSNGAAALPSWQSVPGLTPAALTKTDDTNVTLTLGGTPTTALLQATSITAGWTGQLSLTRGGSNASLTASNGGIVYSTASAMAILAGTATAGQMLQSGASSAPTWSTATYPATAGTSGNVLTSNGTNWVSTSPAGIGSPLTTKGDLYTYTTVNARLAVGATDGQILQVSSGAATGLAWSTPTYPSASGTSGKILRSDGTNNVYSTSTFADTYAVSTLLYASSANAVSGLSTTNRASLSTNSTGVPTWLALTDGQLVIGSSAGSPAAANISAGAGISITNASNSITITATAAGFTVTPVAGTTQAASVENVYILQNAAQTTVTLPSTYAIGDPVRIIGSAANAGGWVLTANTGDTIRYNNATTSSGGSLTCAAVAGQTIEVVADVANTSWVVANTVNVTLTTS